MEICALKTGGGEGRKPLWVTNHRQACSPLIQLFFGFASDIDQTNINRDIRDGCLHPPQEHVTVMGI